MCYFYGLYHADSKVLSKVFHPDSRYINCVSGRYVNLSVKEYLQLVDERVAPVENSEQPERSIISLDIASPTLATVRAEMSMMGRRYTDCLTLIRTTAGWAIIAKAFHYINEGEQ
ncbi:hypothetical protein GCM10022278_01890 [Allohahella marinimesophila]|uniref:Lumazine-binding protein n=2 Tax=Allohahella marinimesophila TaxID=1054972 RepID=A0ABP7NG80_9GAMM